MGELLTLAENCSESESVHDTDDCLSVGTPAHAPLEGCSTIPCWQEKHPCLGTGAGWTGKQGLGEISHAAAAAVQSWAGPAA